MSSNFEEKENKEERISERRIEEERAEKEEFFDSKIKFLSEYIAIFISFLYIERPNYFQYIDPNGLLITYDMITFITTFILSNCNYCVRNIDFTVENSALFNFTNKFISEISTSLVKISKDYDFIINIEDFAIKYLYTYINKLYEYKSNNIDLYNTFIGNCETGKLTHHYDNLLQTQESVPNVILQAILTVTVKLNDSILYDNIINPYKLISVFNIIYGKYDEKLIEKIKTTKSNEDIKIYDTFEKELKSYEYYLENIVKKSKENNNDEIILSVKDTFNNIFSILKEFYNNDKKIKCRIHLFAVSLKNYDDSIFYKKVMDTTKKFSDKINIEIAQYPGITQVTDNGNVFMTFDYNGIKNSIIKIFTDKNKHLNNEYKIAKLTNLAIDYINKYKPIFKRFNDGKNKPEHKKFINEFLNIRKKGYADYKKELDKLLKNKNYVDNIYKLNDIINILKLYEVYISYKKNDINFDTFVLDHKYENYINQLYIDELFENFANKFNYLVLNTKDMSKFVELLKNYYNININPSDISIEKRMDKIVKFLDQSTNKPSLFEKLKVIFSNKKFQSNNMNKMIFLKKLNIKNSTDFQESITKSKVVTFDKDSYKDENEEDYEEDYEKEEKEKIKSGSRVRANNTEVDDSEIEKQTYEDDNMFAKDEDSDDEPKYLDYEDDDKEQDEDTKEY